MIFVTRESQVSYATLSKIKNKRIQFTIKKRRTRKEKNKKENSEDISKLQFSPRLSINGHN
jgi:hypothetical protein